MKVMIDTNIIISTVLFPGGQAAKAFNKAINPPYQPIVCDYIVDELHLKFQEKFHDRIQFLDEFLSNSFLPVHIIPTPNEMVSTEKSIRDIKDRPILRSALDAQADFLLTGDKDFLESSVKYPKIISVSAFLNM